MPNPLNRPLNGALCAAPAPAKAAVFAWECNVRGKPWQAVVNHRTAGKARYQYLLDVRDAWPDIGFPDVTVRKLGPAHTSAAFLRTAAYRGMPDLRCGQRVTCGSARGVIVGHNDCANFEVLFDDDSAEFAGLTLNVHPMDMRLERPSPATPDVRGHRPRQATMEIHG